MKLKNKHDTNIEIPSTFKDAIVAFLFTLFIILALITVYYLFGGSKKLDTNITSFFGAILAFSGLMTKQYLFKETIDYLTKWIRLEKLIDDILVHSESQDPEIKKIINDLALQNNLAGSYASYVKRELRVIPVVPIILVVLYGAALIACDSILFRAICLGLMLLFVTYLTKATISSNNLAIERPDLEQTINELEELLLIIKKNSERKVSNLE
jgi:hypothetical protein